MRSIVCLHTYSSLSGSTNWYTAVYKTYLFYSPPPPCSNGPCRHVPYASAFRSCHLVYFHVLTVVVYSSFLGSWPSSSLFLHLFRILLVISSLPYHIILSRFYSCNCFIVGFSQDVFNLDVVLLQFPPSPYQHPHLGDQCRFCVRICSSLPSIIFVVAHVSAPYSITGLITVL